jgi:hypothetical protein
MDYNEHGYHAKSAFSCGYDGDDNRNNEANHLSFGKDT